MALMLACAAAAPALAAAPPAPPAPPAPALVAEPPPPLYGMPRALPLTAAKRARPPESPAAEWQKSPFYVIQTELSPAALYHSTTRYLAFFTGMKDFGLGGPTYAAYMAAGEPHVVRAGEAMDPTLMGECWILVWFAGAAGWTDWDSPWVIYLEKRPTRIAFDSSGSIALRFDGPAGYAALLPLYGCDKPPQQASNFAAAHGLAPRKVRTWEWPAGLPKDVLARIRYWASVLREFPIYCEDSFSADRAHDTLTIRQRIQYISINDDWQTPHMKFAPVSPPLAQAAMGGKFPVTFSQAPADPDMATPYGPYMGVEGVDTYDANLHVLKYINEMERVELPDGVQSEQASAGAKSEPADGAKSDASPAADKSAAAKSDPSVAAALARLQATAREKFPSPDRYIYDHGGMNNFCWAIMGDGWYAKALPFMEDATRTTALESLKRYFRDDVLVPERFVVREFPAGSGRTYMILEGPGIGSWGTLGDAGKFSSNLLETLWAYAHFTGDWELIRVRWPLVKKLFCTPAEARWATFGRGTIAELGDEAAPCLAMARMAYMVGDMDTYHYTSYMFARELVVHWLKSRGAPYFRSRQPWQSTEFMPEEVYLTNMWGDTAGWQIDGPEFPKTTPERQFNNRWVRFKNEDVARFYRDFLAADVRKEMDLLTGRWDAKRRFTNDSHIMPSLVQLRSLLLNEPPAALAKLAAPPEFAGPPSGIIASCMAVLRTSHPTHFDRLIPGGPPGPFSVGLEREVAGPNPYLAQAILSTAIDPSTKELRAIWPMATWFGWTTPSGYNRWTFGTVRPIEIGDPAGATTTALNWNTTVVTYLLPAGP